MTHTWKIKELHSNATTGLVIRAYYQLITEHNGITYETPIKNFVPTGSISDPGFITYSSLTEADVLTWLETYRELTSEETNMENDINSRPLLKGLPW